MAIHRDAANEGMTRTTSLFTIGPVTVAGFFYAVNFSFLCGPVQLILNTSNFIQIQVDATTGNSYARTRIGGLTNFDTGTIPLFTGTWYFLAAVLNGAGTVSNYYVRALKGAGGLIAASAGSPPGGTFTPVNWHFVNQGIASDFKLAGWRGWSATLTPLELLAESKQLMAVRRLDLRGCYPMAPGGSSLTDAYRDFSDYGVALTTNTVAPTVEAGPDVPMVARRRRLQVADVAVAAGDAVPQVWAQYRRRRVA